MGNQLKFFTANGHRLVSGSVADKVTKDRNNNNAPIPEEKQRYEFGVAMRKDDPDTINVINKIHNFLSAEWSNDQGKIAALNNYWQGGCEGISLKIKDGDKPNSRGSYNDNTKGCYVFYFSNWGGEPPRTVDRADNDIPGNAIKRGYYVQIAGSIKDNGEAYSTNPRMNRCGIYLDSDVIRLVGEGDVIVGGIDPLTAFGGTTADQAQLPEGARPLGSGVGLPGVGTVGAGNAQIGAQGQQQTEPAATQGTHAAQVTAQVTTASHIDPHTHILQGPGGQATQQANGQSGPTGLPGLPGT